MQRIIIGIHGLGNKPPKELLESWWIQSLQDGLERVDNSRQPIPFNLVYWSDILHPKYLDPDITDEEDPLRIKEPYVAIPETVPEIADSLKKKIFDYLEKQLDKIFLNDDMSLNFKSVTDQIIHHYFEDLETYYAQTESHVGQGEQQTREIIQERLLKILQENKKKEILLLAHSMGSIIAYDVLTKYDPEIRVHTLVSIGSPLGVPPIVSRILSKQQNSKNGAGNIKTPENITSKWFNISDPEDKVALDHTLADDFEVNSSNVLAEDILVVNDYVIKDQRNPHKAYGYLRTPEMAKIIDEFLAGEKYPWTEKWKDMVRKLFGNFRKKLL